MIKCCIRDCDAPGIVSANHPNADMYCETHGRCPRCGGSVEYFIYVQELGIWLCPCVAAKRHEVVEVRKYEPVPMVQEKKIIQFGDMQAKRARKRKNA